MRPKDQSIAGLRPTRSPWRPMIQAPSGRVMKPTPKVASEYSRPCEVCDSGKNVCPIWMAK
jgi:hypothetical protein